MHALLVSDLHYDLKKFDWVRSQAATVDLLVVAGDLLDISSGVPLDAQIAVVLEYLTRCAQSCTTVVCSGNHDLDHRTDGDEKATAWITEARGSGVVVDGDSVMVDGWLVSACAWWEGPVTLKLLERHLDEAEARRGRGWIWAYHGPPEGPLSWTGARHYGDPELPRLLDRYRPEIVLCGHIHQSPFVADGGWAEQRDATWLFNSGRQSGEIPSHVRLDLDERRASWWSFEREDEVRFGDAPVSAQ